MELKFPEDNQTYTYQDYEKWEGRWELIKGVPYNMTPAPTPLHQTIVGNIFGELRSFLGKGDCQVFVAPFDVRLSEEDDYDNPETVIQPDVSVVCQKERLDSKGLKGAPELVVEVLSPSTALKDRNEKRSLYQKFGVSEYWIVDPLYQTIERYVFHEGKEVSVEGFDIESTVESSTFKGFRMKVSEIFE